MKITLEITVIIIIITITTTTTTIMPSSNMKVDLKEIGLESMDWIHMAQDRDRP